jgi:hypothetical protein
LGEFDEAGEAADDARAGRKGGGLGASGLEGSVVEQADVADAVGAGDGGEFFPIAAGGNADEFKFVGVRGDDAQGVFTDGAGGAEEDDAFARGEGGRSHGRKRRACGAQVAADADAADFLTTDEHE